MNYLPVCFYDSDFFFPCIEPDGNNPAKVIISDKVTFAFGIPGINKYSSEQVNLLKDAITVAIQRHDGVTRRVSGEPYVHHCIRVMLSLAQLKAPVEILAAAVLHDTVEDTEYPLLEMEEKFGPIVANLVSEVTNDETKLKAVGKTAYLKEKVANLSADALRIKLSDRLDNLSDLDTQDRAWALNYNAQSKVVFGDLVIPTEDTIATCLFDKVMKRIQDFS